MANVRPKRIADNRLIDSSLTAADAAGDTIDRTERQANIAIVRNTSGAAVTVTVHRNGEANQAVTVPAGGEQLIRVATANRLTYSAVTGVTVGSPPVWLSLRRRLLIRRRSRRSE
jgi:hypothetical protein